MRNCALEMALFLLPKSHWSLFRLSPEINGVALWCTVVVPVAGGRGRGRRGITSTKSGSSDSLRFIAGGCSEFKDILSHQFIVLTQALMAVVKRACYITLTEPPLVERIFNRYLDAAYKFLSFLFLLQYLQHWVRKVTMVYSNSEKHKTSTYTLRVVMSRECSSFRRV